MDVENGSPPETSDIPLSNGPIDENNEANESDLCSSEDSLHDDRAFEISKENHNLKITVEKLEKEIALLQADQSKDLYKVQLEALETTIGQQKQELALLRNASRSQAEQFHNQMEQLKNDYERRIEKLTKQYEQASKDREAMVMKYAVSENSAITLQNQMKQLELKIRDHGKEKESLEGKISHIVGEKGKLLQVIDAKNAEIQGLEREVQKKKDELHAQSSNLKFFQNKLKIELENHKEVQTKLDKVTQKLKEAKEETEQVRKDSQSMLMRYEAEGRKELEIQYADQVTLLQNEVESWRNKQKEVTDENNQLCKKIQNLETERLDYEKNLSKLKQSLDEHQQSLVDYYSVQAELESSQLLLAREQERYATSQTEIERLRQTNQELQQEMSKCREREAELLNFTRKLTEKNVAIQSDLISIEAKSQQQDVEFNAAKRQVAELTIELSTTKEELTKERQQNNEKCTTLSKELQVQRDTAERLATQVEDLKGEMLLLKKKHMASIKELSRELQAYRKKGEALETISLGQGSHTSSNTSLNNDEVSENRVVQVATTGVAEPDRQLVIDKIIDVQKMNAKLREKNEFLKENSHQLVAELQKKSRIIQNLVLKQNAGALASEIMDENKSELGKKLVAAALAKQGGIMASVYRSKPVDETMTLELSLEMNQKLQAILEDTLLKNFTLKENMDTLGNEIARLVAAQSKANFSSKT